jgi:hypothetical protein
VVDEHRPAHGVTQQRFDVARDPNSTAPAVAPALAAAPIPPPEVPAAPRPPSGTALRERQRKWLKERARFEASHGPDSEARLG